VLMLKERPPRSLSPAGQGCCGVTGAACQDSGPVTVLTIADPFVRGHENLAVDTGHLGQAAYMSYGMMVW
jgi:hypothetical protein